MEQDKKWTIEVLSGIVKVWYEGEVVQTSIVTDTMVESLKEHIITKRFCARDGVVVKRFLDDGSNYAAKGVVGNEVDLLDWVSWGEYAAGVN